MADPVVEIREPGKRAVRVTVAESIEIGRECDGVILTDTKVSRRHLSLTTRDGGVVATDLGSANGTFLGDVRLVHPQPVGVGAVVRIGDTEIEVLAPVELESELESQPEPPQPAPVPPAAVAEPRGELRALEAITGDGCVVRYRAGTAGAAAAEGVAASFPRARRRLSSFDAPATVPQICLVDPYPDPDAPGRIVTDSTVVDAVRGEIWMVVTPESPPEPLERPLALLLGGRLPAGAELGDLLEGYGLHVAGTPDPDPALRAMDPEQLHAADGEVSSALALSFVRYLVDRENDDAVVRVLTTATPGGLDVAYTDAFGTGLANLQRAWERKLYSGPPEAKPREFLRMAITYIRPHKWRELEMFFYMLLSLAFTVAFPFAFRSLIDTAIPSGEFSEVLTLLAILGAAFVVSLLAGLRRSYLAAYVSSAVVQQIRGQMFERLQDLSARWFHRHEQGDVLSRFFSDVHTLEAGLSQVLREGLFQILSLIVSAVILLTLDPLLGGIVILGAPLIAIVYRVMSNGALKRSIAVQEQTGVVLNVTAENYQAQPVVKAFGLQAREMLRFGRASDRLFRNQVRLQLFGGLFGLSVNMIVTFLRLFVLGLGAKLILDGDLTIGGLVAFMGVMGEVLSPVASLTGIGQQLQASTGALYRVNEVMDELPEIADTPDTTPLPPLSTELRLDHVGFSYTGERRVLDDVDCAIPAGRRVAFVGPSGAGKSSIMQLIMRFYDPDDGAVRFDGRDIRTATLESLRGQLGVVFQDTFLYDATVRENIRLGKLDATDDEVEEAARAAELSDFVSTLPRGFDTLVGERGGLLSGGQRQRLSIARALLRDPAVLLLDEATSALDPRTERLIAATLDRVSHGRTTISVTHRLTSVVDYDRVFVVVQGHIAEQGTHDELVALGGHYAMLWAEQTGGHVPAEAPFDAVAALAPIPLFEALGHDALADVATRLAVSDLAAGETLGEGGGRLSIVRSGRAQVRVPGLDGELEPVVELGPGDCFGIGALLGERRGSELLALERVRLLVLDDATIAGLAASYPSVAAVIEGARAPVAAPVGGQRLSRMTMARPRVAAPAAGTGGVAAPITPDAAEIRRTSGTFPRVS
ncbi:MAG: ABC transporter transmembrane domain-containing protein [Acidimicrobiia bacterium]